MAPEITGFSTSWTGFAHAESAAGRSNDDLWTEILSTGLDFLLGRQAEAGPPGSAAACVYCFRVFGREVKRNRLNRYYCDDCDGFIRTMPGQADVVMPVLAVDIRSSTEIERSLGAEWVPRIREFRRRVGTVMQRHFGFVMNTAGDAMFAIFPPGFVPTSSMPLESRTTEAGRVELDSIVAANAIEAAVELAAASPTAFDGGEFPYGTALHTASTLVFSVAGPDDDDGFVAEDGEFSSEWEPAEPVNHVAAGPVAIDIAGEGIVVASELADAASAGVALISEATDVRAGTATQATPQTTRNEGRRGSRSPILTKEQIPMTEPEPIRHAFTLGGHEDIVLGTHLPMLHMDLHAYHLVLSGRLPDEELAIYLRHRELHPGVAYWMGNDADDSMEIPDILSGQRTSFKASIWCGIPEKATYEAWPWEGVEPIVAGVEFGISGVLYDATFDESEPFPAALHYILFGDDRVAYLHHRMVKDPDFDHLVTLTRPPDGFGLDGPTAELVTFTSVPRPGGTPCSSPVSAGRHVVANEGGLERTLDVGSTMWFSTKKFTPNSYDPCSGGDEGDA